MVSGVGFWVGDLAFRLRVKCCNTGRCRKAYFLLKPEVGSITALLLALFALLCMVTITSVTLKPLQDLRALKIQSWAYLQSSMGYIQLSSFLHMATCSLDE